MTAAKVPKMFHKKRGYQSWDSMKRRCLNFAHKDFQAYGGKGITITPEWLDVRQFFEDMGEAPVGTSLDRVDNSKGYSKENCRWATASQQTQNRGMLRNNTSGCCGVSWQTKQAKWLASATLAGKRVSLYWGNSFFDACCARKSWEARNVCK